MSSSVVQTFPIGAAVSSDVTVTHVGPTPTVGPAPVPSTLWTPSIGAAEQLSAGSSYRLDFTTPLTAGPVLVEALVLLGASGVFLIVDDWLSLGAQTQPGGTRWSMAARFAADEIHEQAPLDPSLVPGTWARVQVVVAHDQLCLLVGGTVAIRAPLGARFSVPAQMRGVWVGNTDPAAPLGLAVVAIADELPETVSAAVAAAEVAGLGEVRGAFHRVGKSLLGNETGPDTAIPGGRSQSYDQGYVYLTPRSGGVVLDGPVAERYQLLGAHAGGLGLPLTDVQVGTAPYRSRDRAAKGWKPGDASRVARFEHGVIAWSAETGAHEVYGRVAEHWLVIGGAGSVVGLPVGRTTESRRGWRHGFQFGDVFQDVSGTVAEVHGAILDRYDQLGAWDGPLGTPLTDEHDVLNNTGYVTGGRMSRFDKGAILWSPKTGAREVLEPWWSAYLANGGPGARSGCPPRGSRTLATT